MRYFSVGFAVKRLMADSPTFYLEFWSFESMPTRQEIFEKFSAHCGGDYTHRRLISITEWSKEDWDQLNK